MTELGEEIGGVEFGRGPPGKNEPPAARPEPKPSELSSPEVSSKDSPRKPGENP